MVSKSVWNLPGGPWERLFAGVWNTFNVAVYENGDKTLLTTIFPKSGEVGWIMVRVDKVLLFPKGFDKIVGKLADRDMHIIKQASPDKRMTYVLLLSPPATVDFGSKEIGSRVFEMVLKINEEAEEIKNIAKRAKVEVTDLKDAKYRESASILGNPTSILSLLSIAPEGEKPKKEKMAEVVIGEKDGKPFAIEEGIYGCFSSIKKGSGEERSYLAQAIIEGAIMDIRPLPWILDFSSYPLKLGQPNPYPYDYSRYGFETANVAFDLEEYSLHDEKCLFRINLNQVSPQYLWKILGLGKDDASILILETAQKMQESKSINSIGDITEQILRLNKKDGTSGGLEVTAVRRLRAADKAYGNVFSSSFDTLKMISGWIKSNSTVYLRMGKLGRNDRLAFTLLLLDAIERLKGTGALSSIEAKRAENIYPALLDLSWFGEGIMQSEIVDKIIEMFSGALFVNEADLPMKIESRVTNRFNITGPGRVKLYVGGRGEEFKVRPLLSCPP